MSALSEQYAVALFELAKERSVIERIQDDFKQFLKGFDHETKAFFTHPNIDKKDKFDVVKACELNRLFQDFMHVIIINNRIAFLNEIAADYDDLIDKMHNRMHVVVKSKKPLDNKRVKQLQAQFEKKYNRQVSINNEVDDKILGGLRFEFEGKVIDDTINATLSQLKRGLTK